MCKEIKGDSRLVFISLNALEAGLSEKMPIHVGNTMQQDSDKSFEYTVRSFLDWQV